MDILILNKLRDWCAETERCAFDTKKKLIKLKVEASEHGSYISQLQKEDFINHERYILLFIETYSKSKKWGKLKILNALKAKGLKAERKHFDEIGLNEEDTTEQLLMLLERKNRTIKDEDIRKRKEKLIRFAMSRGFEMAAIKNCLDEIVRED